MTDNNKCTGSCGTHGTVWVDGYHGQKKVHITSETAKKISFMNEFNVNLANCCVPLINGSVDDVLNVIAPYDTQANTPDNPTPLALYPNDSVTSTAVWNNVATAIETDIKDGTNGFKNKLNPIDCCTRFKVILDANSSTASILKLKATFTDIDLTTPKAIATFTFEFPLFDTDITTLKDNSPYPAIFSVDSPKFFIYNDCLIQFILPSLIFSGDTAVSTGGQVSFANEIGVQCLSLSSSLQDFISCTDESCEL